MKLHYAISSLIVLFSHQIFSVLAGCDSYRQQRNDCENDLEKCRDELAYIEQSPGCTDQDSAIECRGKLLNYIQAFNYDVNVDVKFYALLEVLSGLMKEVNKDEVNKDSTSAIMGSSFSSSSNSIKGAKDDQHMCLQDESDKECLSRLKTYIKEFSKTPAKYDDLRPGNDQATFENYLKLMLTNEKNENKFCYEQFQHCRDNCQEQIKQNVSKYTRDFLTCKTALMVAEEKEKGNSVYRNCYQPSYSDIAKLISYKKKNSDIKIELQTNSSNNHDNILNTNNHVDSIIIKKNSDSWETGQVIIPVSNIIEFKIENLSGDKSVDHGSETLGYVGWSGYDKIHPEWFDSFETWHGIYAMKKLSIGLASFNGKFYGYDGSRKIMRMFKKRHHSKESTRHDFKFRQKGDILTVRKDCGRLRWIRNDVHVYDYTDVYFDYDLYPSFALNGPVELRIFDIKYKDC